MADDYRSIPDGLFLVATVVFWSYALDGLGFRIASLQYLIHPPALTLVRDGRVLAHNLQNELITKDELMSHLREQGEDDLAQVKEASIEGDGRISVIQQQPQHRPQTDRRERI